MKILSKTTNLDTPVCLKHAINEGKSCRLFNKSVTLNLQNEVETKNWVFQHGMLIKCVMCNQFYLLL
jgi:hypothetical protein